MKRIEIEITEELICRFYSYLVIDENTKCWNWIGPKKGVKGKLVYGRLTHRGIGIYAHVLSWVIFNDDVPDGKYVLHKCKNPICVNIEHLFLGTMSQCRNFHEKDLNRIKSAEDYENMLREYKANPKHGAITRIARKYGTTVSHFQYIIQKWKKSDDYIMWLSQR